MARYSEGKALLDRSAGAIIRGGIELPDGRVGIVTDGPGMLVVSSVTILDEYRASEAMRNYVEQHADIRAGMMALSTLGGGKAGAARAAFENVAGDVPSFIPQDIAADEDGGISERVLINRQRRAESIERHTEEV